MTFRFVGDINNGQGEENNCLSHSPLCGHYRAASALALAERDPFLSSSSGKIAQSAAVCTRVSCLVDLRLRRDEGLRTQCPHQVLSGVGGLSAPAHLVVLGACRDVYTRVVREPAWLSTMSHLLFGWTPIGAAALIVGAMGPSKDIVLHESDLDQ